MGEPPELQLLFEGPYSWTGESCESVLGRSPATDSRGIYVWSVPTTTAGELVHYVGQTGRSFHTRFHEHLRDQLSGVYRLYDPKLMAKGEKRLLSNGLYGPEREPNLTQFVRRLSELSGPLREFVNLVRFHLAPLEADARTRDRVEAAIALHIRGEPEPVGSFQDEDVRYKPRKPDEQAISVEIASACALRGLPSRILA